MIAICLSIAALFVGTISFIQQNKADYKDGAAREMIITIINTIAPNDPENAQKYRTQLAGMLAV